MRPTTDHSNSAAVDVLLGPDEMQWPEDLLLPYKKGWTQEQGYLGDVRYSKAHVDQENLKVTVTNSSVRESVAGTGSRTPVNIPVKIDASNGASSSVG